MAAQGQNLAAEVGEELEELGNPVQQLEKPHRVAQNMGLDMAKHYMYLVDSMEVPQVSQVRLQHSYLLLLYPFLSSFYLYPFWFQDPPRCWRQRVSSPGGSLYDVLVPGHGVQPQCTCGRRTS